MVSSPSPFITHSWGRLLKHYPGPLPQLVTNILTFGTQVGYEGPKTRILSTNRPSIYLDRKAIQANIDNDLHRGRISPASPAFPFISSPLGLVSKHDGGYRRIHDLSHPRGSSVNDFIQEKSSFLQYATFDGILGLVAKADRGAVIIKRDIKDAFRTIPLASNQLWLFGFTWEDKFYQERCLPFGLSTAPFIFNLFAEALHWIMQSYLHWKSMDHYLDDFIAILPAIEATPGRVQKISDDYVQLTDCLGIPRNDSKDQQGTLVKVLGIEIDTTKLTARLPLDKLQRAKTLSTAALAQTSLSYHDAQSLAGFLSFCTKVVPLGRIFMRRLWTWIASYPRRSPSCFRRRIPSGVREDIEWWSKLLPKFNGIRYIDTTRRPTITLYSDASSIGLGGFWFVGEGSWSTPRVSQANAFFARLPPATSHINVLEICALQLAFATWHKIWAGHRLIVFTDSTTAWNGLTNQSLRGPPNLPLREVLLFAAAVNISLQPQWIPTQENKLADALSRLDDISVANLCPHWQSHFSTMLLQPPGSVQSEKPTT